jgi:hypothetical protein
MKETLKSDQATKRSIHLSKKVIKLLILFYIIDLNGLFVCLKVKSMMYGFGDDENPYQESVELIEDLVIHFIQMMVAYYLFLFLSIF